MGLYMANYVVERSTGYAIVLSFKSIVESV